MTDHDRLLKAVALLRLMQAEGAYGSDLGCQCTQGDESPWQDHAGDCPMYWDGQVTDFIDDFLDATTEAIEKASPH